MNMSFPITFVPAGGLANRMRAVASALTMARDAGRGLRVIWFKDWALHAPFHDIFRAVEAEGLHLREARLTDLLTDDRPRRRNFGVPRLWQRQRYAACIYEAEVTPLVWRGFDFKGWASRPGRRFMASYSDFYPYPDALLRTLFRPVAEVEDEVARRAATFADVPTVGVHIRRTDHAEAISQSPMECFFARLDADLTAGRYRQIYLATDDEGVKRQMHQRYGGCLLTPPSEADRSSTEGIRGGLADMYTLARTGKIYGSSGSTFSEMAGRLGGIPLEVLKV
ncbi:hypothetical protein IMSAGC014_01647 [Bacteroidaceae bacterium]|nr:glycosyl transferase [Prevotella sp. MGM2]GAY31425.1 glycosyl transferase [Prevotella sp. MGM2]GFI35136.1 hypothetical protein IMSAGC014_01647 [Bacteroidaceae bacterium]